MALAIKAERRGTARKVLTGLLPGKIVSETTGLVISARPVDVTEDGLGILSETVLKVGTELKLITHKEEITFVVAWIKPDFGRRNRFRYGLKSLNQEKNLVLVFEETGCLR